MSNEPSGRATARVWTLEELNRVHPLEGGWLWAFDEAVGWYARLGLNYTICIDASGDVVSLCNGTRHFEPPAHATLAVILASRGQDSLEAMAAEMERQADEEYARPIMWTPTGSTTDAHEAGHRLGDSNGRERGLREAAAMLRRGTADP